MDRNGEASMSSAADDIAPRSRVLLLDRLARGEALAADGAIGTELIAQGLEPGACLELIGIERPELLLELHRLYVDAGAELLTTNTFGGSPTRLARHGLQARASQLNRRATELARRVAGERVLVAGSCGPCGELLKPFGPADPESISDGFALQIESLADGGADLIVIETMTDLREACLAVEAARRVAPQLPVAASLSFDSTPRGFFTMMGDSLERVAAELAQAGAHLIGSNCGHGIETMVELARELKPLTSLPILIQSNAGLPELLNGRLHYAQTPAQTAAGALRLLEHGVSIVGGCCGTTPEHVTSVRKVVETTNARRAGRR